MAISPEIEAIQQSLAYWIYNSETNFQYFQDIQHELPRIFGYYQELVDFAKGKRWSDFSLEKLTTEIPKKRLTEQYLTMLKSVHTIPAFHDDIINLIREYTPKNFNDTIKSLILIKKIEEKKNVSLSEQYVVWGLYDGMIERGVELRSKVWMTGYSTWLPTVDGIIDGLTRKHVFRLAAYSNTGKSKLSYFVCNKLLEQGLRVLYFTLEVDRETVVQQLLMARYNKDFYYISRAKYAEDPHIDTASFFANKDLFIVDDMYRIDQMLSFAESIKPDAIFVDYAQMIDRWGKEDYVALSNYAREVQKFAKKHDCIIFDLSQISQIMAGKYLPWAQIPTKGSGALVENGDVVFVMEFDSERMVNLLHIAKNKFWSKEKIVELEFNFATNQIRDNGESLQTFTPKFQKRG